MIKYLAGVLLLCCLTSGFAQGEKWSVEVHFPITLDNNFVGSNFNGVLGIGSSYRFVQTGSINVGAGLYLGLLTDPRNREFGADFSANAFYIQPNGIVELQLDQLGDFRPSLGVGLSVFTFSSQQSISDFELNNVPETQVGFNISTGLAYFISTRFFIQAIYDFTALAPDDDVPDNDFNSNVNLLNVGVGYRFGR